MKAAGALTLSLGLLALAGCKPDPLYPDMAIPADLSQSTYYSSGDDAGILAGRTLLWHDEFEGAAGAAPDATYWSYDTGGTGWGNQELEFYTSRPSNVALECTPRARKQTTRVQKQAFHSTYSVGP